MHDEFVWICQFISAVSIVLNVYLLYVYFRCPLKMIKSYKYFFLFTAIQDIIFSLCILPTVPIIIAEDFAAILFSIGPLRVQYGGQVLILVFSQVFMTSLLLVANSFIYRYLQVCRPHFFKTGLTTRVLFIAAFVNAAVTGNWCLMHMVALYPSEGFISEISEIVARKTGLNSSECAQIGFSLRYSVTPVSLTLLIEVGISVLLIAFVMARTAVKISRTLKQSALSKNLRKLHQQMFVLLLLQTACTFALLHAPLFSAYFQLFTGVSSITVISYTTTILLSSFPLFGPIIIVVFLKDYRNYTLFALRFCARRKIARSLFVSEMRTSQANVQTAQ